MILLTYKSGARRVIDRAPDTYEIRECNFREVTREMVESWRKAAVMGASVAEILLKKQESGEIQNLGGVNDYLIAMKNND